MYVLTGVIKSLVVDLSNCSLTIQGVADQTIKWNGIEYNVCIEDSTTNTVPNCIFLEVGKELNIVNNTNCFNILESSFTVGKKVCIWIDNQPGHIIQKVEVHK